MKLCVFGNSHTAMLAGPYREGAGTGLDLTFFAQQGRGPEGARLRDRQIRAAHPRLKRALSKMGMPEAVDLSAFDGFAIVAMTTSMFSLMPMLTSHAVFGWPAWQETNAEGDTLPDRPLVSEPALEAAMVAAIRANLGHRFVTMIRQVSDAPIVLIRQPHPSVAVLKQKKKFLGLRQILWRKEGDMAAALLDRAHVTAFAKFDGVHMLTQPAETIEHGFLTAAAYTRGAERLNEGGRQPETDILHATPLYGRLVLSQISQKSNSFIDDF